MCSDAVFEIFVNLFVLAAMISLPSQGSFCLQTPTGPSPLPTYKTVIPRTSRDRSIGLDYADLCGLAVSVI